MTASVPAVMTPEILPAPTGSAETMAAAAPETAAPEATDTAAPESTGLQIVVTAPLTAPRPPPQAGVGPAADGVAGTVSGGG
ncbi:MAG: hypothetical protein R3D59_03710 [Paracoccaceae bacterium]